MPQIVGCSGGDQFGGKDLFVREPLAAREDGFHLRYLLSGTEVWAFRRGRAPRVPTRRQQHRVSRTLDDEARAGREGLACDAGF